MTDVARVQVLLSRELSERFNLYCGEKGFKKSTLIARLVREHLDAEGHQHQPRLFDDRASSSQEEPGE